MGRKTRSGVGALGALCLLACTMGPLQPSMGLYGTSGDLLMRPLHDSDSFLLIQAQNPVCEGHAEGALRFVATQAATGDVELRLVQANPPAVAACLDALDVTMHTYQEPPKAPPPVGATTETIVGWPEGDRAWALTESLLPPRTWGDGCRRRFDELTLPDGRL